MARALLKKRAMAAAATFGALGSGCVIPPPLELDEGDAGVSSPPVITSSGPAPDFAAPGPLVLDPGDERRLSLTIEDNDIGDAITVRFFVDYGLPDPTPPVAQCQFEESGERARFGDCPTSQFCPPSTGEPTEHFLEAMVADREFLADNDPAGEGQPPWRELPESAGRSFRAWRMICQPAE